jgi:hypothetical protein
MPRPAKPPDLSDVDITELMILAVLERHGMGPEWRRCMRGAQLGDMLDLCGGARQVLAEALAAVRQLLVIVLALLALVQLKGNSLRPPPWRGKPLHVYFVGMYRGSDTR